MPQSQPSPPSILVIVHQEHSTPGRLGRFLKDRGFALDIRRPRFGDPLPARMDQHAGVVIFGGPMSANDGDDWVRAEIDWIGVPLAAGSPFLGICLGAQMLARHLGARVQPHPRGLVEVGYYPLRAAAQADLPWPDHVYQWHNEGFEVPAGADLLAAGDAFPNQAIRVGPAAYGFQFHPELTHAMMCRWTTRGQARLSLPNAQHREAHFEGRYLHDHKTLAFLDAFLDRWIGWAGQIKRTAAA